MRYAHADLDQNVVSAVNTTTQHSKLKTQNYQKFNTSQGTLSMVQVRPSTEIIPDTGSTTA